MSKELTEFAEHWFAYDGYPDYELIKRLKLKPVAKQIREVLAHIDAEQRRIDLEDETKQAKAQRKSDSEQRLTFRLRRVTPFGFHRDPVDCWMPSYGGKVYYRSDDFRHQVVAGTIEVHATNKGSGPGMAPLSPMTLSVPGFPPPFFPMGCSCPVDATVIATERWAAEFDTGDGAWTLEQMPA